MEKKLKLYGFNNLTKSLSFNIYDVCYAKTSKEQKNYIAYILLCQAKTALKLLQISSKAVFKGKSHIKF